MKEKISELLLQTFWPVYMAVTDDSRHHASHVQENNSQVTHIRVLIISDMFSKKKMLERHRLVHSCLDEYTQQLHSLALKTYTHAEFETREQNTSRQADHV